VLLEHGADVNARTESGTTALMAAEQTDRTEVANLLREHGAQ
jgi:ankyrin repeat protein